MAQLYSWGANSHGQLGHGHTSEQCIVPKPVEFNNSSKIARISGGGGHVLILDSAGDLHSSGWNSKGQLGDGTIQNRSKLTRIPASVFNGNPVEIFACGWDVSAAICQNGLAYVWGSNAFNQFGIPKTKVLFSSKPHRLLLPENERIKNVVFNLRSTCVLAENGTLYIFGNSRQVQALCQNKQFTLIMFNGINYFRLNSTIEQISAGQNYCICLSKNQKDLFGFGDNKYAQSESISLDENITNLKSGWTHNGALTENGNLYLWGRNNYGQVGIPSQSIVNQPNRLDIPEKIEEFDLGAEHGLARTENNLYVWGWNEHGNCGNNSTENVSKPVKLEMSGKCILVGCGAGFSYAVTDC